MDKNYKKMSNEIFEKYIDKLESLENNEVINIALDIFNIKTFEDLNKYFL